MGAQAARLALQAAVFGGVTASLDAASALVTYPEGDALSHVDVRGDLEWGLLAGVAVPIRAVMALGEVAPAAVTSGVTARLAGDLVAGGLSIASVDVLVRLALGENVNPAEVMFATIPIGPRAKRLVAGESAMLGSDGVQVVSKELGRGKGWRLDLENPQPAGRPGQIHLQDYNKGSGAALRPTSGTACTTSALDNCDASIQTLSDAPGAAVASSTNDPVVFQGGGANAASLWNVIDNNGSKHRD